MDRHVSVRGDMAFAGAPFATQGHAVLNLSVAQAVAFFAPNVVGHCCLFWHLFNDHLGNNLVTIRDGVNIELTPPRSDHYGMQMFLKDWLTKERRTHAWFAEQLGIHQNTVSRYVSGVRLPSRKTMAKITKLTKGKVTHRDFPYFED